MKTTLGSWEKRLARIIRRLEVMSDVFGSAELAVIAGRLQKVRQHPDLYAVIDDGPVEVPTCDCPDCHHCESCEERN